MVATVAAQWPGMTDAATCVTWDCLQTSDEQLKFFAIFRSKMATKQTKNVNLLLCFALHYHSWKEQHFTHKELCWSEVMVLPHLTAVKVMDHVAKWAFDASVFPVFLPENLKELMQKDVFETMFCLHEVGRRLDVCELQSACSARIVQIRHSFICINNWMVTAYLSVPWGT